MTPEDCSHENVEDGATCLWCIDCGAKGILGDLRVRKRPKILFAWIKDGKIVSVEAERI